MSEHDARADYDDEPNRAVLPPVPHIGTPADIMWTVGLVLLIIVQLWMAFAVCALVFSMVNRGVGLRELVDNVIRNKMMWLVFVGWPTATICNLLVLRGANDLKKFRRYWWVVVAAIITFLSIPFVYLAFVQVPLGIWLMLLLVRRDVRDGFKAVARRKTTSSLTETSDARRTDDAA